MEQKHCCLKYPYFSVKTPTEASFGGNQNWSSSRIMKKYGCGVIGISDMLLYLALHQNQYDTDLFHGILREDGYISYPRYERYLMKMRKRYLPVIPGLGIPGWLLPFSLNRYFRHYRFDLRASWGVMPSHFLTRIQEMLEQDIPVVLAIGPNFPFFWKRKGVNFYREVNGTFQEHTKTCAHFVVVTGMRDGYLQISSWGKEYYISWEEYLQYVKKHSNFFASSICCIRKKTGKKKRREK